MGFATFLGRVLFASLFILSAYQMINEFGVDGGPAVKELVPKLSLVKGHLSSKLGVTLPRVDPRRIVMFAIALKGLGAILFVFGSHLGPYLLLIYLAVATPLLHDFYNHKYGTHQFTSLFNDFMQGLALIGALFYFIGTENSIHTRRISKKRTHKTKTL